MLFQQSPVRLADPLEEQNDLSWTTANKDVLWGWKRDVGPQSRSVYFSGHLSRNDDYVTLKRYFFQFRTKILGYPSTLIDEAERCRARFATRGDPTDLRITPRNEDTTVELRFGLPTEVDKDRARRLKLRRPRKRLALPQFPPVADLLHSGAFWPADLYVGSGLSYEAGLPTLCDMHEIFCVDNETQDGFTVGVADPLVQLLAEEGVERLAKFCSVHVMAITAAPTFAMREIANLAANGKVNRIFTDNVDNMLSKVGVEYERVRGSGVFNERYQVSFASPRLIVIGVAADRRQIVRQARAAGLDVIVVNPCKKVSPNVTHLDYLRPKDTFFKCEAKKFFYELTNLR